MFTEGLSLLCKIGDGLAHAFVRFDATNRYEYCLSALHGNISKLSSIQIELGIFEEFETLYLSNEWRTPYGGIWRYLL